MDKSIYFWAALKNSICMNELFFFLKEVRILVVLLVIIFI